MHIVVTGTPGSGFEFFGPFETEDAAYEWADKNCEDKEYWCETVSAPE